MIVGSSTAWAEEITYTFTSKAWTATSGGAAANWTSGKDGGGFSNNGIQVTTSATGANGTSPVSFSNISEIVLTYNTNKSKGAGTAVVKIGDNEDVSQNWAYSTGDGTSANYTLTYSYETPQSGNVKITLNTTTNSIYLVSCKITYNTSGGSVSSNYYVTYDANGATSGTVPIDETAYSLDDEVTVLGNTGDMTKTGCAFGGWNTQADGEGTNYSAGSTFSITANTTLYAKWNPYTITALPNNESYGTVSLSGSVITATPKTGYTYASPAYTVSPENSATVSQNGNEFTVTPSANTTVTINFAAIPTHTATFSINGVTTSQDFSEGATIIFPDDPDGVNGKTFVGWVTEAIDGTTDEAPSLVNSVKMGNADVIYYAVFATAETGSSASLTKMTSSDTFSAGDKVVIVASDNIAMYQETINSSYVNKYTFDNNAETIAANDKKWFTVSAGSANNTWKLGDSSNGYVYNSSSNNLEISTSNSTDFTLAWNSTESKFTLKNGSRWLSYRSDLSNTYFRMGGTNTTPSGTGYFDIYKYSAGGGITYSGYCTTVAAAVPVSGVSVDKTASVNVGESTTLTATVSPDNATNKNVTWASSDESIATVDKNGVVTGVAAGVATITVTSVADNTKTATCTVTVTTVAVTSVSVDATASVNVGKTTTLTATVSPNNATNKNVTWESSDESIATVDENGVVTGVAAGEATITVTSVADNTKTATCTVTVSVVPGTADRPYTISEAIDAIDNDGDVTDVYVEGIISQIDEYDSSYHSLTYWISADGTTEAQQFEVYSGKGIGGANFSSINDLEIGDHVVVKGNIKKYNDIYEFNYNNQLVSLVRKPSITATPSPFTAPSYEVGTAEPTYNSFTVNGKNLTADITLTLDENSKFEMSTDLENWTSTLTITQNEGSVTDEEVAVRLKAGLEKGNYAGAITLTSTGADNVVIAVSGTVTGQTYTISVDDNVTGGTIEADMASAEEGATVTLTATPDAAYTFGSWTVYKDDMSTEVTVTDNQFTMPDCEVYVTATFNAKPTYAVTCVANPVAGGTMEASPASAYEGQTVTLSYVAEDGYSLSSIVITKTSDGSATDITPVASGDDFTFTMPGYAVTATAMFESNTFEGSFAKVTSISALEDGAYYILYRNGVAMNSTLTSGKMGATDVTPSNDIFENPDKSIVWKLVKNGDNWDLYSEKEGKYCYIEGTNTSSFKMAATASYHYVVTAYAEGGFFKFKTTHSGGRGIDKQNNSTDFGTYADSNSPKVYLYKYTTLTERTITFNGNGGTTETDASEYTQTVYDGVEATLDANTFANNGYEFAGWNTENNGSGTAYADKANITVTGGDLTLYAQWAPLYTLTIDNNIEGGSVSVEGDVTTASEGTEITLSYLASAGHAFNSWNVYKADDETTKVIVTNNKFDMPAYNVVVSASFDDIPTYSLATSITPGKHYIIASGTDGSVKAMGKQNDNNRSAVSVTSSNGIIPETTGVYEFVIYGPDANGYYTIYDCDEEAPGYLYAASSGSNYLKAQTTNDMNGKWSISIDGDTKKATIKAQGSYTRNWMRYNSNNNIFSCYGSGQADIYLYEKDNDTPIATTASVKLNASGYATFATSSAIDFLDADNADFSAWQITSVMGNAINFAQITSMVEAGTGILVKGTPGATVNLNILPVGGVKLGDNKLEGITEATAIESDTYYGLSGNKFVKVNAGTVPAGKALLPASEISASARELTFVFNDGTTGISSIEKVQLTNDKYYNLNGQRVENPKKGSLYIVNGKKVIMK
jgi:uncharacterized repeat protein (TIGR02543 family)